MPAKIPTRDLRSIYAQAANVETDCWRNFARRQRLYASEYSLQTFEYALGTQQGKSTIALHFQWIVAYSLASAVQAEDEDVEFGLAEEQLPEPVEQAEHFNCTSILVNDSSLALPPLLQIARLNDFHGHVFDPGHKIFALWDRVRTRFSLSGVGKCIVLDGEGWC